MSAAGPPQGAKAPSGGSDVHAVTSVGVRILVVKLSSLGDVVHAMPAVQDIRAALPAAQIDWVVEPAFAPLVRRCDGVQRVIECNLRRWRKKPFASATREAWRRFKAELQREPYDAVLDLQGLTKSALVAWLARLSPQGKRYALANRTEGSSYEAPTRWVADVAVPVPPHSHAVARSRELCAKALGYGLSPEALRVERYGLAGQADPAKGQAPVVALVHGTSRADKLWPEDHWLVLAQRLQLAGYGIALPHGNALELARSERIAQRLQAWAATPAVVASVAQGACGALPPVQVWPGLSLDALTDHLACTAGVIGVDSGLSHIAVALDLPHVQLYNFDTAWRTGPFGAAGRCVDGAAGRVVEGVMPATLLRQCSVFASPHPPLEAVWQAWQAVCAAPPGPLARQP